MNWEMFISHHELVKSNIESGLSGLSGFASHVWLPEGSIRFSIPKRDAPLVNCSGYKARLWRTNVQGTRDVGPSVCKTYRVYPFFGVGNCDPYTYPTEIIVEPMIFRREASCKANVRDIYVAADVYFFRWTGDIRPMDVEDFPAWDIPATSNMINMEVQCAVLFGYVFGDIPWN